MHCLGNAGLIKPFMSFFFQAKIPAKPNVSPFKNKQPGPSPKKETVGVLQMPQFEVSPSSSSSTDVLERVHIGSVLMELPLPNTTPLPFGRRSSKRISSKNDPGRPDFTELSPTALGLTPRHVQPVTNQKHQGRRSISLTTPRLKHSPGIIKAVSTSKKLSRRTVVFSPGTKENESGNSTFNFNTPDISQDVFVSPLLSPGSNRTTSSALSSTSGGAVVEAGSSNKRASVAKNLNVSNNLISFCTPSKSPDRRSKMMDQQSPLVYMNELAVQAFMGGTRDSAKKLSPRLDEDDSSAAPHKNDAFLKSRGKKSPRNSLSDVAGVRTLFLEGSSPKNALTDLRGVKNLLKTPKIAAKSAHNVPGDFSGVSRLLRTPKPPKSPKNDLTDVAGVKRVMAKSPKNDLTRVTGIKRMLKTPARKVVRPKKSGVADGRPAKSPKNDLTDLRGVKQVFKSPKVPKSPKNDLTDVGGVKELFRSRKSPKNDLTDVAGVKRTLANSPKNDLRRAFSLKKLMKTPVSKVSRTKKSRSRKAANIAPENDLTDLQVEELPRDKSPKNRLSDLRGVKRLMLGSPPPQKSPLNDLSDIQGLRTLFASPKQSLSPRNDLRFVQGVKELFATPEAVEGEEPLSSPVTVRRRARGRPATSVSIPRRGKKPEVTNPSEVTSEVNSVKLLFRCCSGNRIRQLFFCPIF